MPVIETGPSMDDVLALGLSTGVSLSETHGALLIGTFFGVILYGLALHQSYQYASTFSSDSYSVKLLVASVMLLETLHVTVTAHICYYYLVSNYLKPSVLLVGAWSLDILPLVSGLVMFMSQLFFARRVALIGRAQSVVVCIALLLLAGEVGFSIAATTKALKFPSYQETADVNRLSGIGLGLAVLGDSALTITLILAFRKSRKERGSRRHRDSVMQMQSFGSFDKTDMVASEQYGLGTSRRKAESMIDFVQMYIVNTGLLTGLFNLAAFIAAFAVPSTLICGTISIITARLYANSLLAVLNTRQVSMAGMEIFVDSSSATRLNFADAQRAQSRAAWNVPSVSSASQTHPPQIVVGVTTETEGQREPPSPLKLFASGLKRGSFKV
ncbi:hypothetical protein L226DRAFT_280007 [Lentinus tigrinus ALCF2SS1-7]|uniref:DUF6534 domain-containing protein n=1 Tax=Lentinus tigrinus ALCF2SS1-6 TaxID=1328759 RepID=A0A5C2RRM5_9APHY|nr:hypothetical protein L227DRAFT_616255 [Lentinus tigrinus ALCF2SS1-6]RPD69288.1 hypothetical protein L226DRAFT_280007 [Lentinus tigrinus ALCF2SS1-7]